MANKRAQLKDQTCIVLRAHKKVVEHGSGKFFILLDIAEFRHFHVNVTFGNGHRCFLNFLTSWRTTSWSDSIDMRLARHDDMWSGSMYTNTQRGSTKSRDSNFPRKTK